MAESSTKHVPQPLQNSASPKGEKEDILIVAESFIEQYRIQVLVGAVLVVAIIVAYFSYTQNKTERTSKAWNGLSLATQNSNIEEVTAQLEKLNELDARGTVVEPWVLWELIHKLVSLDRYEEAKEQLQKLRKNYPQHYLNQRREIEALADSTPTAKSMAAIESELSFWQNWKSPEKKDNPQAELLTSKGSLRFELYESHCPNVVKMFVHLAENGFYENIKFRDAYNNRVYSGSLMTDGRGSPGYTIRKEYSDEKHGSAGALVMERMTEDLFDGKFYVTTQTISAVDSKIDDQKNTVFGRLVDGEEKKLNYVAIPSRIEELKTHAEFKKLVEDQKEEAGKEEGRQLQQKILEALKEMGNKTYLNQAEFENEVQKRFTEANLSLTKELLQAITSSLSGTILSSFSTGDILFKITISQKRQNTVYIPEKTADLQK